MPIPSTALGLSFIPADVLRVMETLHSARFDIWLVGGALRDFLLGIGPKDWDLATSAAPQQIMALFPRVIPVGIRHGTVQVRTRGRDIEVTSFEPPGETGILRDLGRRDFTMNALALSYPGGLLIDPNNGRKDLDAKLIRGVGDPGARFSEDPLRIVRAGRLSGTYGFAVDSATFEAMREYAERVTEVSGERIRDEICKMLLSPLPIEAFDLLRKGWALGKLLPELVVRGHVDTVQGSGASIYRNALNCVIHCPERLRVRLAALFHQAGVPALGARGDRLPIHYRAESAYTARERMKNWNMSNRLIDEVSTLIENQLAPEALSWSAAEIRRFIARVGPELLDDFTALAEAVRLATGRTDLDDIRDFRSRILGQVETIPALSAKDLAISGKDVMEILDIPQGPEVGRTLSRLFNLVLDDPHLNTRKNLIQIIKHDFSAGPS
ncbi:MAG: CCA tRNA nucleotidyltransferase [Syntrophobacteraceae bacterium]